MGRRLAAVLVISAALPLAAVSAGDMKLQAVIEQGNTALRLKVDAPLPPKAFVTVRVTREIATLTKHEPATLSDVRLPFETQGHAETVYKLGQALSVPGRYRVQVSFEKQGQYPDVLKAVGEATVDPAEAVLVVGMDSKDYVAAVLQEQAFLADSLVMVGDFIERMNALEAEVAANKDKGVKAWADWRAGAVPRIEELITHGRQASDRFYPETYRQFAETFVFSGLFQMESRKFGAALAGGGYHGTGFFKDKPSVLRKDLEPYEQLFLRETVFYRLMVVNALYEGTTKEAADQAQREDRARWDRKRASWEEILGLWSSDLGQAGPPAVKEVPHRKELSALGTAVKAWWDAEEKARFGGGPSAEQAKQAVKDAFQVVKGLFEK